MKLRNQIKYNNINNLIIVGIDNELYEKYKKATLKELNLKNKKWFIYWLSLTPNENGIFYIWQTNNFFLRFYQHINLSSLNNASKNKIIFDTVSNQEHLYMIILEQVYLDSEYDNLTFLEWEYIKKIKETNDIENKAIQKWHKEILIKKINGKFNINDFLKQDMILINKTILQNYYNMSEKGAEKVMTKLNKNWLITKINKGNYIFNIGLNKINRFQLSMLCDNESYISINSVLERNIIKQEHTRTFVLSNRNISKNQELLDYYNIVFIETKIPMNFWIEIINNVRYSDTERALLDLIYLHVYTQFPIASELYLKWNINEEKINRYLAYYPIRVKNFYFNKLHEYSKS